MNVRNLDWDMFILAVAQIRAQTTRHHVATCCSTPSMDKFGSDYSIVHVCNSCSADVRASWPPFQNHPSLGSKVSNVTSVVETTRPAAAQDTSAANPVCQLRQEAVRKEARGHVSCGVGERGAGEQHE